LAVKTSVSKRNGILSVTNAERTAVRRPATRFGYLAIALVACATLASAAFAPVFAAPRGASRPSLDLPTVTQIYCSGIVTKHPPRTAGYVVSGPGSTYHLEFSQGDSIYIHVRESSAVKSGEEFLVVRAVKDPTEISWFHGETRLRKRMGRMWEDVGRLRVVEANPKITLARIVFSCVPMERGDRLTPFVKRTFPRLPTQTSSRRGAKGQRVRARVVEAKGFRQEIGAGETLYLNAGSRNGAEPGSRVFFFQQTGVGHPALYQISHATSGSDGFGHSPVRYPAREMPPELLGEGIILRVSPTASTVLVTSTRQEIVLGDSAAIE
jgi:hypothetical protein